MPYGKLPKVDKFKLQELIDLQAPELETYVEEGNVPIFGYNTVLYSNRCKEVHTDSNHIRERIYNSIMKKRKPGQPLQISQIMDANQKFIDDQNDLGKRFHEQRRSSVPKKVKKIVSLPPSYPNTA